MPKAKTHVAFVRDSYIIRFEAAIGLHPDIPQDLKLSDCRASFVARRGAKVETMSHIMPHVTCNLQATPRRSFSSDRG